MTSPALLSSRSLDCQHTPTEVLRILRHEPGLVALLGSWLDGQSLVAVDPLRHLEADADPFAATTDLPSYVPQPDDDPAAFGGGWIGAWGYQLGRRLERIPPPPPRTHPQRDAQLAYYDHALRHTPGGWVLDTLTENAQRADAAYERLRDLLAAPPPPPGDVTLTPFAMTPSASQHRAALAATLEHIVAGDIFQANVCVRLESQLTGDPLDLFCKGVDALAPAYAAFVRTDTGGVASFSPELFLRRRGRDVLTSPIKGTAPLDADPAELLGSAKNRAENIMIVDLMRNDLGRVCEPGSIKASATVRAERHSVWHLVSDVEGRLRVDADDADLLRATFPPGSVTGAPKVRAMEIIHELEATARERYTGAIGFVSPVAGLELNVVIRTFEVAEGAVWLGVGGGVVADSTPDDELAECLVKASPLVEAVGGTLLDEPPAAAPDRTLPVAATPSAVAPPDPGRGIYDSLLVVDGRIVEAAAHRSRWTASRARLGLGDDDWEAIERNASRLVGRHRLRLDAAPGSPTRVTNSPLAVDATPWQLTPVVLRDGWGDHKWRDRDAIDVSGTHSAALIVDERGAVLETGRSSIFAVHDDGVVTPPLDGRILPGIARARVLEILAAANIPVVERRLTLDELSTATEVFVTNALRGVVPVAGCDGVGTWAAGRTTSWLAGRLADVWTGVPATVSPAPRPVPPGRRVLLIDNYDSFVYNLAQFVQELGAHTDVVRNDAVTVDELLARHAAGAFTHLIVSPGPGVPAQAGISNEAVARLGPLVPTLGVCLGHQCIGEVFGASVVRAPQVVHGKPSLVHHDGRGVYAGLDGPLVAARYHSLVLDPARVPAELSTTAHTAAGVVMGVRHVRHAIEGVQMHPESILTPQGHGLLANFLASVG